MATASIDLSALLRGLPEGAWVAISEETEEVIAYAADLQTVLDAAAQRGISDPLVVRVPEKAGMLFFLSK